VTHGLDDSRHRGDESAQAEATYLTGALNTKFPQPPLVIGAAAGIRTQLGVRPFGPPDRGRGSNIHIAPDISGYLEI